MIESEFEGSEGAEAVGFSHGEFGFVVQTFDNAAGKLLLSQEIVEDEFPVLTQGAGDLLHRFDARAHGLAAPFIEEFAGPGGRIVIPELLKGFLKKVGADGLEVVAEEIAKSEALVVFEIPMVLKQQPARLSRDRRLTPPASCGLICAPVTIWPLQPYR